jgi:hypothetical protein
VIREDRHENKYDRVRVALSRLKEKLIATATVGNPAVLNSLQHTAVVVLLLFTAMAFVLASGPSEQLSVKVSMVTGEHSRDSNSTSTSLTVERNKLKYEQTYYGYRADRRPPVKKEYEVTANDRAVLIGLLRQKNLLVNKSLAGLPQEPSARTYFSLSVDTKFNGQDHSIKIEGGRNDEKLKETDLYRDSVLLIQQLYKIINRTDPDIAMPELIN